MSELTITGTIKDVSDLRTGRWGSLVLFKLVEDDGTERNCKQFRPDMSTFPANGQRARLTGIITVYEGKEWLDCSVDDKKGIQGKVEALSGPTTATAPEVAKAVFQPPEKVKLTTWEAMVRKYLKWLIEEAGDPQAGAALLNTAIIALTNGKIVDDVGIGVDPKDAPF